jgi:solute:Na+ symporter, SSS family
MNLTFLDWAAILLYFAATLALGLYFRRRAGRSAEEYFASGRAARWWLAGTSMVATTFAADTPLVVAGLVYAQGIAGNWLWWSFLPSGMMTVFLFARLWRRSGLLTDVQFAELRYAGRPAAFLRGFRALYLGLLMNCLILGWVTRAMVTILAASLGVSDGVALALCVLVLIPFTGVYVAAGGLRSVLWTDLFQFFFMMAVVVLVAWYGVTAAGGLAPMLERLEAMRPAGAGDPIALLPDFSRGLAADALWTLPLLTFLVFLGVQWWAFWYPGAEPGGGGYIAQRIFSARDERHGLLAVLWFNIAHYALRPWPWILTALAAMVLYPGLDRPESGYMLVVTEHVPPALRGLVLAGFLAAFMSTVTTHLNWGASYLVQDFYRRFLRPGASERHYVGAGRVVTVILVAVTGAVAAQLATIREGWQFVLEVGAGTGLVYLLRWYWWRINAWSEISAMATALAVALFLRLVEPFSGAGPVLFAKSALTTTAVTTLVWVAVTLLTRPEPPATLAGFYRRVRPDVRGWKPVAAAAAETQPTRDLGANLAAWVLGCAMVYAALFGAGKLLLGAPAAGGALLLLAGVCGTLLYRDLARRVWSDAASPEERIHP